MSNDEEASTGFNRVATGILGKKSRSSQQKFVPIGTLHAYDRQFSAKKGCFSYQSTDWNFLSFSENFPSGRELIAAWSVESPKSAWIPPQLSASSPLENDGKTRRQIAETERAPPPTVA